MTLDRDAIAEALAAKRADLAARAARYEEELRSPLEADFAEQAVDREDDEALDGVEQTLRREIAEVDAALARLRSGDYGFCVRCGEPIAPARLLALPSATECIDCASGPRA